MHRAAPTWAQYVHSVRVWTPWKLKSTIGLTMAQTYEAWALTKDAEVLTYELPDRTKLHWTGPRRVN